MASDWSPPSNFLDLGSSQYGRPLIFDPDRRWGGGEVRKKKERQYEKDPLCFVGGFTFLMRESG